MSDNYIKMTEAGGNYSINELGKVVNNRTGRATNSYPDKDGYFRVVLWDNNIKKRINLIVHRLIAIYFIPNPENKPVVNHKNGIKQDNRLENLEWCTIKENSRHAYDNKLSEGRPGVKHHNTKLTEDQVNEIIQLAKTDTPRKEIAKKYKIHKNHIYRLLVGTRWGHLSKGDN